MIVFVNHNMAVSAQFNNSNTYMYCIPLKFKVNTQMTDINTCFIFCLFSVSKQSDLLM